MVRFYDPIEDGEFATPDTFNSRFASLDAAFFHFGTLINPLHEDYGALGDGETDDYAALQAAIDYADAQGGGMLFLPPGYVFCTSLPLEVPRSISVGIIGVGRTSILENTGTGPTIKLSDDATNVSSFLMISNFRIDCTGGGSGIYLNNSRDQTLLSGTVAVTNGSRVVAGTNTTFASDLNWRTDRVIIDGSEVDIRYEGVIDNDDMELSLNWAGSTGSGLAISRARYGNGSRWAVLEKLWIQGPDTAVADTYGIKCERVNNCSFDHILIRAFDTGFHCSASANGRSAGCRMHFVIVSGATTYAYYFYDSRAFAMKRCRGEGNTPTSYYLELCDAFVFDQVSCEDDHSTAGFYFKSCNRLQGSINVGTNFGGGVGVDLVNSDLCTFHGGQIAYQALRDEDYDPSTGLPADVIKPGVRIDANSQGNLFDRVALENGTSAVSNSSTTSTVRWLDWDGTRVAVVADNIPKLERQKTYTGDATLSVYDAGVILVDTTSGNVNLTLPNASTDNLGLRFCFIVVAGSNTLTVTRAGSDVIDDVSSAGNANSFTATLGNVMEIGATTVNHWTFTRRLGNKPVADMGALTDSTGGTASNTLSAVSGSGADTAINNALASIAADLNALRNAVRAGKLMS